MNRFALLCILLSTVAQPLMAAENLSKSDIEKIVREYIVAHPEVIIESMQGMQDREQQKSAATAGKAVKANQKALLEDAASPVAGNPKGDVTLVEFFDYNCGYCKKMLPVVNALVADDQNLRVVFKELPVLGPSSELAAHWALSVYATDPSKYFAYHTAVMNHSGAINDATLSSIVTKLGMDAVKVKEKANAPETRAEIEKTQKLAQALGIRGTPALVVGEELIPGATSEEALAEKIQALRAKK